MSGLPAALWLLGLFAAAPALRTSRRYDTTDRVRDALIVGLAIPMALGLTHLLYPIACWVALALCIAIAAARRFPSEAPADGRAPPYLLIAALLAVAWPQLVRPLLDGDSLSYHLPNASAWVHAHSLWTTATQYWWYPPASELFASALYAVAGPFALPWSGFCALALLGLRVVAWAREAGAARLLADAFAAATITAYPLAIQGGTLQNDVWLAAFFLETLWLLRAIPAEGAAMLSVAVTALIKPQGWIVAAIALAASRARLRFWLAALAALGVWLFHDALLWKSAVVSPPASTAYADPYASTILAHGLAGIALLAHVLLLTSPFALLALSAALLGPCIEGRRNVAWAALAAALLFVELPFGYESNVAQLATGASLRFAAPAIAAGAVLLLRPACRLGPAAVALTIASTLFGCWYVLSIFWNDGSTHVALAVAALGAAVAATAHLRRIAWPNALAFGLGVIVATHLAARHPVDYYTDALRVGGTSPGVYRWIQATHPPVVGGWGLRLGTVNVLSPQTRTLDVLGAQPCVQARRQGAMLIAVAQSDLPEDANARRLAVARACGPILYQDAIAVVAAPKP